MDTEIIFVVTEAEEGGFEARALSCSIHTQADTMPELREVVRDAVRCHFDESERPKIIRLHFVKDEALFVVLGASHRGKRISGSV